MTAFQWTAQSRDGEQKTGTITAKSREEAAAALRAKGLFPDSIAAPGEAIADVGGSPASPPLPASSIDPLRKIGIAVAAIGFVAAALIFIVYDITVRGDIVNLGKLGEKIMLVMFALSVFVAGVVVAAKR